MSVNFSRLQRVVRHFNQDADLTVNRPGVATVVNNRRVSGALVPVAGVRGSCWPVSGKSITLLQGIGQRPEGAIDVFISDGGPLQVADDSTSQPGYRVMHEGDVYEISQIHPWTRAPFYHYIAVTVRS